MSSKQTALFDDRFLESFAGKGIISDPKIAIIELIANAWDAASTRVDITWPLDDGDNFSIVDNGHGMTESEFNKRFRTLAYDRNKEQGNYAIVPSDHKALIGKRPTFGRNGKGRLSGFAFGEFFQVKSWKAKKEIHYKVFSDNTNILAFQKLGESSKESHGTQIFVNNAIKPQISFEQIKIEIGMRFMTDPHFEVHINGEKISFLDIPNENIDNLDIEIKDVCISL